MKLIESRKNDTLNEVDKFDDDQMVLKASPKIKSRNSKLSHFRGVSNNGRKWQVMIMGFAKKIYFGGIETEEEASHKYDKYAILMHGLEVRNICWQILILNRLRLTTITQRDSCEKFFIPKLIQSKLQNTRSSHESLIIN